jgi:hypothetical protein
VKKSRLLQKFRKVAVEKALKTDAVRLYMLLLANCPESGYGKISPAIIRNALGDNLSSDGLNAACSSLEENRFIEFSGLPPKKMAERNHPLVYRLLPIIE